MPAAAEHRKLRVLSSESLNFPFGRTLAQSFLARSAGLALRGIIPYRERAGRTAVQEYARRRISQGHEHKI